MKKNVTCLLALLVIFTGCGNTDSSDKTDTSNKDKKTEDKTSSKVDNSTKKESPNTNESNSTDTVVDTSSTDTASTDNSVKDSSNSSSKSHDGPKITCSEASKLVVENQGMTPPDPIPATWDNQDGTFTVHLASRTLMSQGSAYGTIGNFLVKADGSVVNVSDDPTYPKSNAEMCN